MIVLETGMCLTQRNSIVAIVCIILMIILGAFGYGLFKFNMEDWKYFVIVSFVYFMMSLTIFNFGERVEYKIVTFEESANINEELQGYKVLGYNEKKNTWRIIWEK